MKQWLTPLAVVGFLAQLVWAQNIVSPILVLKDGDASAAAFSGTDKEIVVDGGARLSVGWMVFQTEGVDRSKIASAKLVLYVKALANPGTLQVRALTASITAPENNVPLAAIPADSAVAVSLTLGTGNIGSVVQIDITALAKTGSFQGVALTSEDGLTASFDAKEGQLAPVIYLTHNVNAVAASWLSGTAAPTGSIGKDGDYYLNTATGDVSSRSAGSWTVATNLVGPVGSMGPPGTKGTDGATGAKGADGTNGTNGLNGISISWLGSFPTAPLSPTLNQAYRNTVDSNAYIWNGASWSPLVTKAARGDAGPQGPVGPEGPGRMLTLQQIATLQYQEWPTYSTGSQPVSVAFDGMNIWVANYGENSVTKLIASTGALVGTYAVGKYPDAIAFDGANIWVANSGDSSVTKLVASTGALVGTYAVGKNPKAIAFDGVNIWVANWIGQSLTKLLASTGTVVGTFFIIGDLPTGIAFDGTNIWVLTASSLRKVLPSTGAIVGNYSLGTTNTGVACDGTNVWVVSGGIGLGTVRKVDASTGTVVGTYSFVRNVFGIAFDGTNIWVSNPGDGTVSKLLAETGAQIGTYLVGLNPQGMAFDGTSIWVANKGSNSVTRLK